jgi:hypothetical protein
VSAEVAIAKRRSAPPRVCPTRRPDPIAGAARVASSHQLVRKGEKSHWSGYIRASPISAVLIGALARCQENLGAVSTTRAQATANPRIATPG